MHHKIIFIGGVHGIGKTTLCKSVCTKFNVIHHSASKLITKYSHIKLPSNMRVENINRNQDALIQAINKYLDTNKNYLLDGHFCLLDQDGVITKIPLSTFTAISPMAIILLHDDPSNIYSRLQDRDREILDIDLLSSFQEQELHYSRSVATKLNIPYLKANRITDRETIDKFIADMLE
ncbi:MAG TPA: ATP-binding protein [Sedimentisphaerales bacterium]|nr:ATP-binding protein [Sedimentisphaerales bacterium]